MADQQAPRQYYNSSILFKNKYKKDTDGPDVHDLKGKGDVICPHCQRKVEFDIKGWKKAGKNGQFYGLRNYIIKEMQRDTSSTANEDF